MAEPLLVRDVMRIGVPTCRPGDTISSVAVQMAEHAHTAMVVLDEDGDSRGWINERCLVMGFLRSTLVGDEEGKELTAADIMEERVPECPADLPLAAAVQIMLDMRADHLFFLHHGGGRAWPASVLSFRDVVRVLAGPEYVRNQGAAAPRPTPMDLFRQRYRGTGKADPEARLKG